MKAFLRDVGAWLGGVLLWLWYLSARRTVEGNDPRPALRARGQGYAYALLHAHQLAAVCFNDERRMAAMVSRSTDGELLVPSLRLRRVTPVRGSSRRGRVDKGGRTALQGLTDKARAGWPVLVAVDGPRGPRNWVHKGVVYIAREAHCPILPVVAIPSRRWILTRTWDRFQIPQPFAHIRLCFGPPIHPGPKEDAASLSWRVKEALENLERRYDPEEAARVTSRAA